MSYKLYCTNYSGIPNAAITTAEDGKTISFIFDENNPDYQAYLKWLEEGNTPLPAEE